MKKIFIIILILCSNFISGQTTGYYIPLNIQKAYNNNTKSFDGKPGKYYWQNKADYDIHINFDPSSRKLIGNENIIYFNNSPDTLNELVFHIFPDFYKKGNRRDFDINPEDESDGISITRLIVDNKEFEYIPGKNISINHTSFTLNLDNPVMPGSGTNLKIEWNYFVNKSSDIRTGGIDSASFFIAYFFPRLAVYDDINGWNNFDYTGDAEFYNDFGNFNLEVTVPQNYVVWATGLLQNPEEVFTEKYLNRYNLALTSDDIIHITDSVDYLNQDITTQNFSNTLKFSAVNVTDVAFALSDHYLWDAVSPVTNRKSNQRTFISAAYNKYSNDFYEVAGIARKIICYMSDSLPGIAFPFPSMTVFNGLDYMEYPMMVNDTTVNIEDAYELSTHEISHSYFPFYMGINETNYAWMDEGMTSFITYSILKEIYPHIDSNQPFGEEYKNFIGNFGDEPLFVNSNNLKRPHYNYVYYDKALSFYIVLQDYLGKNLFKNALQEYMNRWNGKHPTPYDFFYCFENVTGDNLEWLIKPWFFEYGFVDLSIQNVSENVGNYEIDIEKKGLLPANFALQIKYSDDEKKILDYKASVWMNGKNIFKIKLPSNKKIKELEIIDKTLRDGELSNNKFLLE